MLNGLSALSGMSGMFIRSDGDSGPGAAGVTISGVSPAASGTTGHGTASPNVATVTASGVTLAASRV